MTTTNPDSITVPLDTPLQRGEGQITAITLRKPRSGELRGLSLFDLMKLDATASMTLLPRISTPSLTRAEAERLDPADLFSLAAEVANFLSPKAAKAQASPTE